MGWTISCLCRVWPQEYWHHGCSLSVQNRQFQEFFKEQLSPFFGFFFSFIQVTQTKKGFLNSNCKVEYSISLSAEPPCDGFACYNSGFMDLRKIIQITSFLLLPIVLEQHHCSWILVDISLIKRHQDPRNSSQPSDELTLCHSRFLLVFLQGFS